jgi:5-(carboxyamino)imidazole ribonucleotide synthase
VATLGLPSVLKTRRFGYDGKGQRVLRVPADLGAAWAHLAGKPLVLEAFVPFTRELSIVAVRGHDGSEAFYPLVENVHREGILRRSVAPAPGLTAALQSLAEMHVRRVFDRLRYVGVLTIELFQVGDELVANEMAPRVHNSGHWTIDGAATSQFENHVRAITGWPLGPTTVRGAVAMVNLIGRAPDPPPCSRSRMRGPSGARSRDGRSGT